MQSSLFSLEELPAPAARPVRPAPAAQPPARIDGKAQYEGLRRDLAHLADRWEDLHLWVLRRHLRLLASPHTEDDERADLLSWLNAPLAVGRPAAVFSLQACLALWDGRIDPAEFRRLARQRLNHPAPRRPARAA